MKTFLKKNVNRIKLILDGIKNRYRCFTKHNCKNMMIIYQMGKVGSSSIYFTLKDIYKLPNILHMHHINPRYLEPIKTWHLANRYRYLPRHLLESEKFYQDFSSNKIDKKIKIITLVRDPIAVYISSIFQNMDQVYYEFVNEDNIIKQKELIEYIINTLGDETRISQEHFFNWYDYFMNWFDYELKNVFGIDIYITPFNPMQGYQVISSTTVDVLLMKVESLNQAHEQAFSEFLGIQNFNLMNSNIGENKKYGECYRTLLKTIVIPNDLFEKIYSHKMVKHFYNDLEIETFKLKWKKTN